MASGHAPQLTQPQPVTPQNTAETSAPHQTTSTSPSEVAVVYPSYAHVLGPLPPELQAQVYDPNSVLFQCFYNSFLTMVDNSEMALSKFTQCLDKVEAELARRHSNPLYTLDYWLYQISNEHPGSEPSST